MNEVLQGSNPAAVINRVGYAMGEASLFCFEGINFLYFFNGQVQSQADVTSDAGYAVKFALVRKIMATKSLIVFITTSVSPETLDIYMQVGDGAGQTWLQSGDAHSGDGHVNPSGQTLDVITLPSIHFCGSNKLSGPVKQHRARLVVSWETRCEARVSFSFFFFLCLWRDGSRWFLFATTLQCDGAFADGLIAIFPGV
jgi:hypothetical protein